MSYDDAERLFFSLVVQSLRTEFLSLVPWSLSDLADGEASVTKQLAALFNGRELFGTPVVIPSYNNGPAWNIEVYSASSLAFRARTLPWMNPYDCSPYKLLWGTEYCVPAEGSDTMKFLESNNLIGTSRLQTISNLLDWCKKISHASGGYRQSDVRVYWGACIGTPAIKVIEGHPLDPSLNKCSNEGYQSFPGPIHATQGCWGTGRFVQNILRVANIPALIWESVPCDYSPIPECYALVGHAALFFPTEAEVLVHVDLINTGEHFLKGVNFGGNELLISLQTFFDWFQISGSGRFITESECGGLDYLRRPSIEVALAHLSPYIQLMYLEDQLVGTTSLEDELSLYFDEAKLGEVLTEPYWGPEGDMLLADALQEATTSALIDFFGLGNGMQWQEAALMMVEALDAFLFETYYCTDPPFFGSWCQMYCDTMAKGNECFGP